MTSVYSSTSYNAFSNVKLYTFFAILLIHAQLSYSQTHWSYWDYDYSSSESDDSSEAYDSSEITLSTPEQCARNCTEHGEPLNCYYKFHIEFYTTVGPACDLEDKTQCVLADGFEKTIIPINRQMPGPAIQVCLYDRVIVDVTNAAPGMEVTIHWHGIFQNGFQYYDGVPYVTQCPIASSTTFRYDFVAENPGTHFYHSHVSTHMLDGQAGALIVRTANNSLARTGSNGLYDVDNHIIFLQDWMHELSIERYPGWYRHDIGQIPTNILINGLGNWTDPVTKKTTNGKLTQYRVEKGKRYRFRMINSFSTVCLAELRIEKHRLTVIAQDGADVKPVVVDSIISSSGERVDFILNANQSVGSYWVEVRGLGECRSNGVMQLAILNYGDSTMTRPPPPYNVPTNGVKYNSLDATKCNTNNKSPALCVNQLEALETEPDLLKVVPDERHILPFWFFNYTQYGDRLLFETNTYRTFFDANDYSQLVSTFNEIVYETPASPLLSQPRSTYQTVCKKNLLSNCTQPCTCAQVINSKLNNVVELIIYDQVPLTDLHHPFHLHGYEFRVFSIGQFADGRNISRNDINGVIQEHTQRLQRGQYKNPPGKDTVKIPLGGYAIIRFKANNPGWWLLHCHFSWHHLTGMELVIRVGDDDDLPPPPEHFPRCNNWRPALHTLNDFYGFRYPDPQ